MDHFSLLTDMLEIFVQLKMSIRFSASSHLQTSHSIMMEKLQMHGRLKGWVGLRRWNFALPSRSSFRPFATPTRDLRWTNWWGIINAFRRQFGFCSTQVRTIFQTHVKNGMQSIYELMRYRTGFWWKTEIRTLLSPVPLTTHLGKFSFTARKKMSKTGWKATSSAFDRVQKRNAKEFCCDWSAFGGLVERAQRAWLLKSAQWRYPESSQLSRSSPTQSTRR